MKVFTCPSCGKSVEYTKEDEECGSLFICFMCGNEIDARTITFRDYQPGKAVSAGSNVRVSVPGNYEPRYRKKYHGREGVVTRMGSVVFPEYCTVELAATGRKKATRLFCQQSWFEQIKKGEGE